jgi:hypothetical protein
MRREEQLRASFAGCDFADFQEMQATKKGRQRIASSNGPGRSPDFISWFTHSYFC